MLHSALCSSCKTWFSSFHKNWLQRCGALFSASFFFLLCQRTFSTNVKWRRKSCIFRAKFAEKLEKRSYRVSKQVVQKTSKQKKKKPEKRELNLKKFGLYDPGKLSLVHTTSSSGCFLRDKNPTFFKLMFFKRRKPEFQFRLQGQLLWVIRYILWRYHHV